MSDYNSGAIISGGLNGEGTRAGESFATEIWGPVVETKMKEKLVLSPLFNDLSSFVATQGERIHLPKIGQVTAGTKGEAAITFEASSSDQSEEILNIDQHKFAAVVVDDIVQVQGNYDLTQLFSAELGYALAKGVDEYLDGKIIDSFKSATGKINAIDLNASPLSVKADFDLILGNCLAEDPDPTQWTIVVPPAVFSNLANIADLSLGTAGSPLGADFGQNGVVSRVYGFNLVVSQNVTTSSTEFDNDGGGDAVAPAGYVLHSSAAHIAYSINSRVQSDYSIDHLGTKIVADTAYGCLVRNSSTTGEKRAFLLH